MKESKQEQQHTKAIKIEPQDEDIAIIEQPIRHKRFKRVVYTDSEESNEASEKDTKRRRDTSETSDSNDEYVPLCTTSSTKHLDERKTKHKFKRIRKHRKSHSSSETEKSDERNNRNKFKKSQMKPSWNSNQRCPSPVNKKKGEISNDVAFELKSMVPYHGIKRRRTRKNSGSDLVHSEVRSEDDAEDDNLDDFVDNEPRQIWNLESSSSSDEADAVQEDPENLDLNSENFDSGSESSESNNLRSSQDDKDDSSSSIESSIESEDLNEFCDGEETKCVICVNLEDTDIRHRDKDDSDEDSDAEITWCKCENCEIVSLEMHNYDRICCTEIKKIRDVITNVDCITEHPSFEEIVLKYESHCTKSSKNRGKRGGISSLKEFRNLTDSQKISKAKECFLRWIFGNQLPDLVDRIPVPACVVAKIRKQYAPSAGPKYYEPFRIRYTCAFGLHCKRAKSMV